MSGILGRVDAVLRGRAQPYTRPQTRSAIAKQPMDGPVSVGPEGLAGDEQGDPRVHGGRDKAVHHYPFDHYVHWRHALGDQPLLTCPGAFGENLSSCGITEAEVCLGDRLKIGSALFEVSQARQPCWKLNDRFGIPDMALRLQSTARTGWYYRVLEPGVLRVGDSIMLAARPYPQWSLLRLLVALYRQPLHAEALVEMLALPLPPSWRRLVEQRLARKQVEDWSPRLKGPTHAP